VGFVPDEATGQDKRQTWSNLINRSQDCGNSSIQASCAFRKFERLPRSCRFANRNRFETAIANRRTIGCLSIMMELAQITPRIEVVDGYVPDPPAGRF
jgi:hypothetical protein